MTFEKYLLLRDFAFFVIWFITLLWSIHDWIRRSGNPNDSYYGSTTIAQAVFFILTVVVFLSGVIVFLFDIIYPYIR